MSFSLCVPHPLIASRVDVVLRPIQINQRFRAAASFNQIFQAASSVRLEGAMVEMVPLRDEDFSQGRLSQLLPGYP
jgi:hypothetical protein